METRKVSHSDIGSKYRILGDLGVGTFGSVALAVDTESNCDIAIKHIPNINIQHELTKRTIRELTLLNSLRHINIISILDAKIIDNSLYMMTELCEYDLHTITHAIGNPSRKGYQIVTQASHYILILGQILKALSFVHANNVIHRDIKPGNILVNSNLLVKLCDFGFARSVDNCGAVLEKDTEPVTEYMVTRWYRAPELLLNPGLYGKAQDVWSIACTFGELIRKRPLFRSENTLHQLHVILDGLDPLTSDDRDFDMFPHSRRYLEGIEAESRGLEHSLHEAYNIHPQLLDLLKEMLQFNPIKRITCEDALQSLIFQNYHLLDIKEINKAFPISTKHTQALKLNFKEMSERNRLRVVAEIVKDLQLHFKEHKLESPTTRSAFSSTLTSPVVMNEYNESGAVFYSKFDSELENSLPIRNERLTRYEHEITITPINNTNTQNINNTLTSSNHSKTGSSRESNHEELYKKDSIKELNHITTTHTLPSLPSRMFSAIKSVVKKPVTQKKSAATDNEEGDVPQQKNSLKPVEEKSSRRNSVVKVKMTKRSTRIHVKPTPPKPTGAAQEVSEVSSRRQKYDTQTANSNIENPPIRPIHSVNINYNNPYAQRRGNNV